MITIQHLCKAFGDHVLFEDWNLTIQSGEYVVVCGESGCGKTTLLNLIGGLERADRGSIEVFGQEITDRRKLQRYYAQTVGFVFQNFALVEEKTVLENLLLIHKRNRSGVSITEALEQVDLADKLHHKVHTLSGGEQQRIALARLMLKKCDLILADEPTGSLDRKNAELVLDILDDFHAKGKTILLVTHDETVQARAQHLITL